jgi:hypothetical protein
MFHYRLRTLLIKGEGLNGGYTTASTLGDE